MGGGTPTPEEAREEMQSREGLRAGREGIGLLLRLGLKGGVDAGGTVGAGQGRLT